MSLDKKRWIVLGTGCLIKLCAGSLYSWSVMSIPMENYLNEVYGAVLAAGGLATVFTVVNMVGSTIMKNIFTNAGQYNSAFAASAMFTAAGFIILMIYKSREKKKRRG